MKYNKMIHSLLLCAFSFCTIIPSETPQPESTTENSNNTQSYSAPSEASKQEEISLTPAQKAELMKIIEFAEKAITKAFSSLQKIENTLTEVALLIRKGTLQLPMTELQNIMDVIRENKMMINALLKSQSEIAELQDPAMYLEYAHLITEFCNNFIPYFNEQIKTNFKNAKPFDLKHFVTTLNKHKKRSKGQHLKPELLKENIKKTNTELAALHHSVKNIGLTFYNKFFRKVDEYVVTPANKWNVPTIAYYAGCTALFSFYSIRLYGYLHKRQLEPTAGDSYITSTFKTYYNKMYSNGGPILNTPTGPRSALELNPFGQSDGTIPHNASGFDVADFMVNQLMSNQVPVAALGATYLYTSFSETWKDKMYPWLATKRDDLWNFLRGGEYRKNHRLGLTEMDSTRTFKDMVGLDEVKEAFSQIIQYIDNPEKLMRLDATPEKGWLLTGPTRTGKSFSVECLSGEIKSLLAKSGRANTMRFFTIDSFLINKLGIKDILEQIQEVAPAVIFIDEIDLLGLNRVGNNQLLSEFLTSMQSSMNADPSKIVIVIAATNNPENIDKALRQPGRFGKEIRFEYPSRKDRRTFIERELSAMATNLSEFDIEALVDKTNQKSFEALKQVILGALAKAWFNDGPLTQQALEHSIDREIHHIIPFSRKDLPENELRIIATHFAGKALAMTLLETHDKLDKVTIHAHMPDLKNEMIWDTLAKKDEKDHQQKIEYGYLATKQPYDSINMKTEKSIINEAMTLIAGFAAEELLLNSRGFTCHPQSHDRAFKMITDLVFGGLNHENLPKEVNQQLKLQAYNTLKKCHEDAMKLLQQHKDALSAIVDELMQKKIMTDKEVQAVIDKVEGTQVTA